MMRVSVLMPVFNGQTHLASAVESVLSQTHRDFELILIDDGSTDGSLQIMETFANQDDRVRILSHENRGMGESLNRALEAASTEWVVRMDADDIMLPHRIESQIAFVKANPDVRVTACLAQYINDQGRQLGRTGSDLVSRERFGWYLENNETIGLLHPGVMMHRQTVLSVGGYRGRFWPADDIDLWNRVAEQGHLILVQPEVLMQYRLHGGSAITSGFFKGRLKYEWVRACLRARRAGKPEPGWEDFQAEWQNAPWWIRLNRNRKTGAKYLYRRAGHSKMNGHTLKAVFELMMAACLQPDYTLVRLKNQLLP